MKPKINQPKIKFVEPTTFEECLSAGNYRNAQFKQNPVRMLHIENESFDTCLFTGIDFTGNFTLTNINFYDCRLENCDLSNLTFSGRGFHRCIFKNCKLIGTNFYDSALTDVQLIDVNGLYLNFANCEFKNTLITNSNLKGCNIIESKTKDVYLQQVNLTEAEIYHTNLNDIDFSTSDIEQITIDLPSLKGIKVNSFQAMSLAGLLGIKVV